MHKNNAKIVCLVPSWTETFIEAGLNVVGRTRFCIHPADRVGAIAVVGGTKNLKIEEIVALKPDYVVLDKEENKKEMAEELERNGIRILVSHVQCFNSASEFLNEMSLLFESSSLSEWSDYYRNISRVKFDRNLFLKEIVLKQNSEFQFENCEYVIWKNPFMVVGKSTFISAVLKLFSIDLSHSEKYPKVSDENLLKAYNLFSSEPYPFEKDFAALGDLGFNGALVDGEKISWYGVRNIRFLKFCQV